MSTKANAPTTQVTMANPRYSSSSSGGAGGGGPGPVSSGGNSGITSDMPGSITGGGSPGGPTASGSGNSQNNPGSVSVTNSASNPASTGPACPNYDGQQFTNPDGSTYNIQCNSTFSGTVLPASNSTGAMLKRQSGGSNVVACMSECDQISACVAIVVDCSGTCTLLGSVTGIIDGGVCGVGAMKTAGPNTTGTAGVVTVSVCAGRRTGTTTMFTTATLTTCPANAQCTAGGGWRTD